MWLVCTQRCGGALFSPLEVRLVVDSAGEYQEHRVVELAFVCLNCGAPAVDLGAVPVAMADDDEEEEEEETHARMRSDVLCPACETRVSVFPGEECPNCGAELEVPQS